MESGATTCAGLGGPRGLRGLRVRPYQYATRAMTTSLAIKSGVDSMREWEFGPHISSRWEFIMASVSYAHIDSNAQGEPVITGTRIKVRMIVLDRIARGWDADEIQRHHPDLSLGQIHSALMYFFDHKQEMDRDIADRHERTTSLRAEAGESPGRRKLRERGLLP
jgi:uncharacterized protein (DUF433 family)